MLMMKIMMTMRGNYMAMIMILKTFKRHQGQAAEWRVSEFGPGSVRCLTQSGEAVAGRLHTAESRQLVMGVCNNEPDRIEAAHGPGELKIPSPEKG